MIQVTNANRYPRSALHVSALILLRGEGVERRSAIIGRYPPVPPFSYMSSLSSIVYRLSRF